MKRPLLSVIIPVYNIAPYLRESLDSVISQTVGFEDTTEVVLVDDGSTDGSAAICRQYVDRFPNNIFYIHQQNGGVSRARNRGFSASKGEYIHFFDGDDSISKNFYSKAISFLQKHENEADFVAAKLKFFDEIIDSHPLNYKFHSTRVIDLLKEPDAPILHVISCVFKRSAIENNLFDEKLTISEDVKFLSDVILRKKKYGVIKGSTYHYRKRSAGGSAIGGKEKNRGYYIDTPKYAYQHMIETWSKSGDTTPIEYTLLYDISYRLDQADATVLDEREKSLYKEGIRELLGNMSPSVVASHRFLSVHKKIYILGCVYGDNIHEHLRRVDGRIYINDIPLCNIARNRLSYDFIQPQDDGYKLEGCVEGYVYSRDKCRVDVSGHSYDVKFVPRVQKQKSFFGDVYDDGGAFEVAIDSTKGKKAVFIDDDVRLPIHTKEFTRLATYGGGYRRDDGALLVKFRDAIGFYRYSRLLHFILEIYQVLLIATHWKVGVFVERFSAMSHRNFSMISWKGRIMEVIKPSLFVIETVIMIPRAIFIRGLYYTSRSVQRRPLWIVSDRGMAAGDNGEAFFRYLMSLDNLPVDVYFAISRKSEDYRRLKAVGPVLDYGSLKYKLKFLLANKIISSHADIEVTNPFLRQIDHFVDLYRFDFVFLQHGVIRNDLSSWLNRFDKNISLFITSAQKEYNSILTYPYYYSSRQIILSGMPRYDYLENQSENKLIIAPTYRNGLLKLKTDRYGRRDYDPSFQLSGYAKFYNELINDKRLLKEMEVSGMVGELYIHPNFASQIGDFKGNDTVKVQQYPYDYKQAISTGTLLVSDYSSVVLDFAYLKKPVIYAQFDQNTFFNGHAFDKGDFFSDERDGFGPIYTDYDRLVEGIIHTVQQGNVMNEAYISRVEAFFAHNDRNACSRVYEALLDSHRLST